MKSTPTEETLALETLAQQAKRNMGIFISDGGHNNGSVFFARSDKDFYLVTAAHCLQKVKDPNSMLLSVYGTEGHGLKLDPSAIVRFAPEEEHLHPLIDIGLIQISAGMADSLAVNWTILDEASSCAIQPRSPVCIAGFPDSLAKSEQTQRGIEVHPGPLVFFSNVSSRVPDAEQLKVPLDPAVDFFVEFEEDEHVCGKTGQLRSIAPVGMSGCAVFSVPPLVDGENWYPSDVVLVGVQSSFVSPNNLLRLKRIEYVNTLVEEIRRQRP